MCDVDARRRGSCVQDIEARGSGARRSRATTPRDCVTGLERRRRSPPSTSRTHADIARSRPRCRSPGRARGPTGDERARWTEDARLSTNGSQRSRDDMTGRATTSTSAQTMSPQGSRSACRASPRKRAERGMRRRHDRACATSTGCTGTNRAATATRAARSGSLGSSGRRSRSSTAEAVAGVRRAARRHGRCRGSATASRTSRS